MPVEVQQETLDACRVALEVTIPNEQYQQEVDRVFHQMARRTQVPGFRPGKAPRRLIERVIDNDRVTELALERVVAEGYQQALAQTGITPYDEPDVHVEPVEEGKPVSFRVTIPLPPKIELGEYRGLTFRRLETAIQEPDVDAELERIRQEAARYEDVDEPAKEGDRVLATAVMSLDGQAVDDDDLSHPSWLLVGGNLPEFDAGILGIAAGEERVFEFSYPEDFAIEERRGRRAEARVAALKVQRRVVPELDDAFAASLGQPDVETVRAKTRESLQARAGELADSELNTEILQEIVSRSQISFPEEMVTREVADELSNFVKRLQRSGFTLQGYLSAKGMDLKELEAEYGENARRRIKNTLAILKISEENDLDVSAEDVEQEISRRAEQLGAETDVVRRFIEQQDELDGVRSSLRFRKVLQFLKQANEVQEKKG